MSWFLEKLLVHSKKNGRIKAERSFGKWQVWVDGCGQTTIYTNRMWKDAFTRLATFKEQTPKVVLMLGLGAGGGVKLLYKQFPISSITAVEFDPEMIALTKKIKPYAPYPEPEILEGDAAVVVHQLPGGYDLIIVDLFVGPEPSTLCTSKEFIEKLRALLTSTGALIINVNRRPEYLQTAQEAFAHSTVWKFETNTLGAFFSQPFN